MIGFSNYEFRGGFYGTGGGLWQAWKCAKNTAWQEDFLSTTTNEHPMPIGIASVFVYGSAVLSGLGFLTAQGIKTILGQASLSGTGQLVVSCVIIILGQVQLLGQGILSATGNLIKTASVILSGTGSLVANGTKIIFAQAVLVGQGILTAIGKLVSTTVKTIKNISLSKHIRFYN